jgi:FtsH-binding integral membrane protein
MSMISDPKELRRAASKLLMICALIESAGWACIAMYFVGVFQGPAKSLLLVPGILMAGAGLFGVVWVAVQMSKIPKA